MSAKRALGALLLLLAGPPALAAPAPDTSTLLEYVRRRADLAPAARRAWEAEVRRQFGGAALEPGSAARPEFDVAKAVLSAAIFAGAEPRQAAKAARDGWHDAMSFVPPPIAIHYNLLVLEGRPPRGISRDLAFRFPDYYSDELAPELVAYWEKALEAGTIPDDALTETREALDATRVKMRPLLVDKLRLMARLARELAAARGTRPAEIQRDLTELEAELARSFSRVALRPEVIDARRSPYDRLRIQLEDMGLEPSAADRALDPSAPAPPRREVPRIAEPQVPRGPGGAPLAEPTGPPVPVLPDQRGPGDARPVEDPVPGRPLADLVEAYRRQLEAGIVPWAGTPYRWGNATPGVGTDCSGFTRGVFDSAFAVPLPRTSVDQFRTGASVPRGELRAGDLVFFDTAEAGRVTHVGVFVGEGRFAHAAVRAGVTRDQLESKTFARAFRGARRVLAYPQ